MPCSRNSSCRRTIDWQTEPIEEVLAKLRAADSSPGVLDQIGDTEYYLFGGHPEDELRGRPGTILARRNGAICRATALMGISRRRLAAHLPKSNCSE